MEREIWDLGGLWACAYPVFPHRVSEALGAPRAGDEPDLHFGKAELCGPRCQDHVTLPARVSFGGPREQGRARKGEGEG